ncbi:single-stranded DNA-binding protein [Thermoplasma sp.]|uniref:single-stranded DNA-binding protein n=1 Tax=Thermoplasma sp. TaxID=1973142 RepID=UPI0026342D4C|nr:single-stranded DNA-binding protein [Thermoplasma sp.]
MEDITKIKDLTPSSRRVNVVGKVLSVGEPKTIQTKFGDQRSVTEVTIGDDTGKVILSLWGDQASQAKTGETLAIGNGYVSLVRGHIRLNVGKYGSLSVSDEEVADVNEDFDASEKEYENFHRSGPRRDNFRRGGYGGRSNRDEEEE